MTLTIVRHLQDGFGPFIACHPTEPTWVSATTNVANVWYGDDLAHVVRVSGYTAGRPDVSADGTSVTVGFVTIDAATGSIVERVTDRSWLTETLDAGSVTPDDFSSPAIVRVPRSARCAVLSSFMPPRGRDATHDYAGPTSQLLLVDLEHDRLVAVLVADASLHRGVLDASHASIAAATPDGVATWSAVDGAQAGTWATDAVIDAIAVSPVHDEVATVDRGGVAAVWTIDGTLLRRWQAHDDAGAAITWARSGEWLATGSRHGQVKVWSGTGESPVVAGGVVLDSVGGLAHGAGPDRLVVAGDRVHQGMAVMSVAI